ncbi:hypothetical protein VTK73DRAFT_8544 [Phialemonium thermophilum]|uniref:Uncharacterized protein n=1 Tax=Phialemonium thermophilum TaxID=223376 RepID=A0ABR3W7Y9_9PEZI
MKDAAKRPRQIDQLCVPPQVHLDLCVGLPRCLAPPPPPPQHAQDESVSQSRLQQLRHPEGEHRLAHRRELLVRVHKVLRVGRARRGGATRADHDADRRPRCGCRIPRGSHLAELLQRRRRPTQRVRARRVELEARRAEGEGGSCGSGAEDGNFQLGRRWSHVPPWAMGRPVLAASCSSQDEGLTDENCRPRILPRL